MITVPELAADALSSFLAGYMNRKFGSLNARLTEVVPSVAKLAMECIGNTDALYHNVEHTMLVTIVGHDIMEGRALLVPTLPSDYANLIVSCLMHDIGYVRGILKDDGEDEFVIDAAGHKTKLPRGSSDAALTPYHVDRSKLFVMDRIATSDVFDASKIAGAIECTRFPVADIKTAEDEIGLLLRGADLIGQLGDPNYLRKVNALYCEFEEVGMNRQLGYDSPADLLDKYPQFYWTNVSPHIQMAIRYLNITARGRQWIANLYSNVFQATNQKTSYERSSLGPRSSAEQVGSLVGARRKRVQGAM